MRGLSVLVGDIGAGKTTLARRLLDALPEEEYEAALFVIIHSGVTASWLLRRIALQLGVENPAQEKLALGAVLAAAYGGMFGLLPIGWIILNVIFLYQLTSAKGDFAILQRSVAAISDDKRLQLLFIAFSLGAFFEGADGPQIREAGWRHLLERLATELTP